MATHSNILAWRTHGQNRRVRCRGFPSAHSHGMLVLEQKKNGVRHLCPKFWDPSLTPSPGQGNLEVGEGKGEGNGTPLQYSCLENPMDRGAWQAFAKSRTQLSDFSFTFHIHALEREMTTHSSVLAWRIPGTGEPGGLPSVGLHKVGHD